jgi:hypothetical protein
MHPERIGEVRHESRSIPMDKSEALRLNLKMGVGELTLAGGASKLMEGDFRFAEQWEPTIDYRPGASRSELSIGHRKGLHTAPDGDSQWNIKLNDSLALDIDANLGVGEARMDLGTTNLRSVNIHMGVGELRLDLRGTPKRSYDVHIEGGVGEATVYLPTMVAVLATAKGGIGNISVEGLEKRGGYWLNPAHENDPIKVRVDVKGGIGEIRLVAE